MLRAGGCRTRDERDSRFCNSVASLPLLFHSALQPRLWFPRTRRLRAGGVGGVQVLDIAYKAGGGVQGGGTMAGRGAWAALWASLVGYLPFLNGTEIELAKGVATTTHSPGALRIELNVIVETGPPPAFIFRGSHRGWRSLSYSACHRLLPQESGTASSGNCHV